MKTCVTKNKAGKHALLCLSIILLASCRLVITTDETGHITSASGLLDCDQASCAYTITEKTPETFTAVPADGYRFVRWTGVCTSSPTEVCRTTVAPLAEEHSQHDGDIGLSAVFESSAVKRAWYRDRDGDHFGTPTQSKMAYQRPSGFAIPKTDCDDNDATIRPWVREREDGVDNNCNGKTDEGFVEVPFYLDSDGDGFGDPAVSVMKKRRPSGYVRNKLDCNDSDARDNPKAGEMPDNRDNDCDGMVDEGGRKYYRDVDGDGFGGTAGAIESLEPVTGYVTNDDDCDDRNDGISPAAREKFDSVDNDCDGQVDEGFTARNYYRDIDSDGYGDSSDFIRDVTMPEGYVANAADNCIDVYNPGQTDIDNDGVGDACDPFTDTDRDDIQDSVDNCPTRHNRSQSDVDGDGLGDACDNQNGLDLDNDGVRVETDNCPNTYNPSQSDIDDDGLGDACDAVDDRSGGGDTPCSPTAEEQSMLNSVNDFRSQARECGARGVFSTVPALSWSCELKAAALSHSMDMANNNFFSHTGSNGSSAGDRASLAGFTWSAWGENIAAGASSVSTVMQMWIDSPGHCANLMNSNFTHLGAAKYSNASSTYGVYWTQVFGRPR